MNTTNTDPATKIDTLTLQIIIVTIIVILITFFVEHNKISTFFEAGNKEKEITVALYPSEVSQPQGSNIHITPIVSTNEKKVGYIDLKISFNRSRLEFMGLDNAKLNMSYEILVSPDKETANNSGKIDVIYSVKDVDAAIVGPIELSGFLFTIKDISESVVTIDTAASQIVIYSGNDTEEQGDIIVKEAKINFISTTPATPSIKITPSETISQQQVISPTITNTPFYTAPTTDATSSSGLNH
jgi:hypothetical protein